MRMIDADALINSTDKEFVHKWEIALAPTIKAVPLEDYRSMEQTVYKLTQALAKAEPVKHGRWEIISNTDYAYLGKCSICKVSYCISKPPLYCPNCGEILDEVDNG